MDLSQDNKTKGFSGTLPPVIPLKNQEDTKIKINGKSCQSLVDTRATLYFKPHSHKTTDLSE